MPCDTFSSQNETNATITSQGHSEETQQENKSAQRESENMTIAKTKTKKKSNFLCYNRLEMIRHIFVLFSWRQELISNWTSLSRATASPSPVVSIRTSLPLVSVGCCFFCCCFFDCQYLKHYSMMLLWSSMDFFLSSSPIRILCFVFVCNYIF